MGEGDDDSSTNNNTVELDSIVLLSLRSIIELVCIVNIIYFGDFSNKYSFQKVWDNEGPDELQNKIGPPLMKKNHSIAAQLRQQQTQQQQQQQQSQSLTTTTDTTTIPTGQDGQSQTQPQPPLLPQHDPTSTGAVTRDSTSTRTLPANQRNSSTSTDLENTERNEDYVLLTDNDTTNNTRTTADVAAVTCTDNNALNDVRVPMTDSTNVSVGLLPGNNIQQEQVNNNHYEVLSEAERLRYDNEFYKQMLYKYVSWSWRHSTELNNSTSNNIAMPNNVIINRYLVIGRYITIVSFLVLGVLLCIHFYETNYIDTNDTNEQLYQSRLVPFILFLFFQYFAIKQYISVPRTIITRQEPNYGDISMYIILFWLLGNAGYIALAIYSIHYAHYIYRLKSRMSGLAYNFYGIPGNGLVYHTGCIPLVFGWFLFWIPLNAISLQDINSSSSSSTNTTIPIYLTYRIIFAFLGIIGIITVKNMFGSIEDENSSLFNTRRQSSSILLSSILVTLISIIPWIVLSVTVFIENENNIWHPIILCIALLSQWLLTTIPYYCRSRLCYVNVTVLQATDVLIVCNYCVISVLLYWNTKSITACILSIISFTLIIIGNIILEKDRKRPMKDWVTSQLLVAHQNNIKYDNDTVGANQDSEMQQYHAYDPAVGTNNNNNNTDNIMIDIEPISNPYYQVYSIGPVLYTTGMFLFGWSLTILR